jgi:hypothetical protein
VTSLTQAAIHASDEKARLAEEKLRNDAENERQRVRARIDNFRQLGLAFMLEAFAAEYVYEQAWIDLESHLPENQNLLHAFGGSWVFMVEQGFWVEYRPEHGASGQGVFVIDFCPKCGRPVRRHKGNAGRAPATNLAELGTAVQRERTFLQEHVAICPGQVR